jgi:hypothetical protein
MNTTAKGIQTEAVLLQKLTAAGYTVLIPFGGGVSYDLVYEDNGEFVRVQCKTGRYRKGAVVFNTSTKARDGSVSGYTGKADVFGVWCEELNQTYLVPIGDVSSVEGRLRVTVPKNNQQKGIHLATKYRLS